MMDFDKEVFLAFESDEARDEYLTQCFGDDEAAKVAAVASTDVSCEA